MLNLKSKFNIGNMKNVNFSNNAYIYIFKYIKS